MIRCNSCGNEFENGASPQGAEVSCPFCDTVTVVTIPDRQLAGRILLAVLCVAVLAIVPVRLLQMNRNVPVVPQRTEVEVPWTELNTEGVELLQQKEYARAAAAFEKVLAAMEAQLGSDDESLASILNNLAATYESMGQHAVAERYYRRSIRIMEKAHGAGNARLAVPLGHLASVLRAEGEFAGAEMMYQRCLDVMGRTLDLSHQDLLPVLKSLATMYQERGDHAKAELQYARMVRITEKSLGPTHPSLAEVLYDQGLCLAAQDRHMEAESAYERALIILDQTPEAVPAEVEKVLEELVRTYSKMGDKAKEANCRERLLRLRAASTTPPSNA